MLTDRSKSGALWASRRCGRSPRLNKEFVTPFPRQSGRKPGAIADANRRHFFQTQCSASKTNESQARFLHFSHRKIQLVATQRTDGRPSAFRRPDRDGSLRLVCAGVNAVLGWGWRGCGGWRHRDVEHRAGTLEPNVWRLGLPSLGQYQQRRRSLLYTLGSTSGTLTVDTQIAAGSTAIVNAFYASVVCLK